MDYFAVIFQNPGEDHIIIPNRFVRSWGHNLINPLRMKTSSGVESIVSFKKLDNTLWLDTGWSAFAHDYTPNYRDVILFQYTGDSKFEVSFFKPCGLEKRTALNPRIGFPTQFFKPFMKTEYYKRIKLNKEFAKMFRQQLSNPLKIYYDNGPVFKVEFFIFGDDIWLDEGWEDVSANCGIQLGDFLFFKYYGESRFELGVVDNKEKPLICTRIRGVHDVEPAAVHEQTLWYTKITKSVKGGNQPLINHIPANIVREWFNGKPDNIDIMIPAGDKETWTLIWYEANGVQEPRPNQCHFGRGWYEFAKKTDLHIGQHIRFFHRSNEAFMRVDMIHGGV